jgi:hemoglobin/transferrin/lactoferrin receptor protein
MPAAPIEGSRRRPSGAGFLLHSAALCCLPAWAQDAPADAANVATQPTVLELRAVTATRTARSVDDVPGSVTVVPVQPALEGGARGLADLYADEPDLSFRAGPSRFTAAGASVGRAGNEGINIRGLEGNQVLMLVDGIRVPNAFSFGGFATGRGDYFGLDLLSSAEVLRGPASTQYGSDGLAGVLSLRTLDPEDVLRSGRHLGGFVRLGYTQADRSAQAVAAVAGRREAWQGLLVLGTRRGHETQNQGDIASGDGTRTAANPAATRSPSLLAKLMFDMSATQRLGVTLESHEQRVDTAVLTARAVPPLMDTSTLNLDTHDRVRRQRVSLDHHWHAPSAHGLQQVQTMVYTQRAEVSQLALEDRNVAPDRVRDNRYTQDISGLNVQAEGRIAPGAWPFAQRPSAGIDWSRSQVTGVRDGTVPPMGEAFPVKPFPDTRYTLAGLYLQNEIETERLSVIPALRYDSYRLAPSADGYSGGPVSTLSGDAVTPRLGIVWRASPAFAPYLQLARGFRAPTPDQVNNGFSNLASPQPYQSIGNPNLKAERARSVELGLRGTRGAWRWSAAAYDNRYADFISQQVVGGSGVPGSPLLFQYVNLADARIRGWELRTAWQPVPAWTLNAAVAAARGDSEVNGVRAPLDTIDPLRLVLGAAWQTGAWQLNADMRAARGKAPERTLPVNGQPAYAPPGYAVLDVSARWRPRPGLTLSAGLNNVTDRRYTRWADVRGLADSSPVKDAYTAPGRHAQVSMRVDF